MKKEFVVACSAAVLAGSLGARTVTPLTEWEYSRDGQSWSRVEVPHDAAIAGPFDPKDSPSTGKLPWKGVFRYRRTLVLAAPPKGKRVYIDFDGVQGRSVCTVNGEAVGRGDYGYLGYRADATPHLFAGTNKILVVADTTKMRSRWYPGAGMYRKATLVETDDVTLEDDALFVTTPEVCAARATVNVKGSVRSYRPLETVAGTVRVRITDPQGKLVASGETAVTVPPCDRGAFALTLTVAQPQFWEMVPQAALYGVKVEFAGAGATDELACRTGFRTFAFTANDGFHLNGRRVQLYGVDLHSDLGILGMAFNTSAMRRQFEIMRDMGVNALRTSHNAPAPELLDLCDEMGIFVWDEAFDKWNGTSCRVDEELEGFVERHLKIFARRDRNHPSVFVWSIGNEITPGAATPPGQEDWAGPKTVGTSIERCTRFRNAIRAVDTTRPVGIGSCFSQAAVRGDYATLDVTGWNYQERYREMREHYPDKPILYTESASALSEYGYYAAHLPSKKTEYALADLAVDSYDRNAARWSDIPDREFALMERDRFVAGEFVWTGIDYLGEPTPYMPHKTSEFTLTTEDSARSSYFGICDLLAFPKDRYYLYRAYWNKRAFTLHLVPDHWNFSDGRRLPVYVYTSAAEAELFVNGKSLGRRRKDPTAGSKNDYYSVCARYRLMWNDVAWEPGEVKAVAYDAHGKKVGETAIRTAGAAARVVLTSEKPTLPDDPNELVFVKVTLADAAGVPVPRDNRRIAFKIEGPGEIVSVGNSDPHGTESFKDVSGHKLCHGRAGLVLRRLGKGPIKLTASSDALAPATLEY